MWCSPIEKLKNASFLASVRENADYRPFLDRLTENYRKFDFEYIPSLTYSMRMTHDRVGTREEFELPFFERRYFLATAALLALLYPENEEYLFKMQDILWAICDEWSWAGCSHTRAEKINAETFIDLFAAETGLMLTEICVLLSNRMDEMVVQRTEKEVRRRIIQSYESRRFWWEWATNNWTMVCSGNVAATMLYLDEEAFERQRERLFFSINNFMNANPDDGTCLEGLDYWHYGFGNYVWFADLYRAYTDGKIDLLNNPKAECLAGYPTRNFLCGNTAVSIADSLFQGKADIGLLHYLIRRYPQSVSPLPSAVMTIRKGNVGWHELSRNLLYFDPSIKNGALPQQDFYFAQAEQAIVNRKNYSLFVKAGHNDEPHNHNDVGSFILATKQGQILCDIGAGRYVDAYFQPTTRYDFLCNSSRGHSIPIINGHCQESGKTACGKLLKAQNSITVDFSDAYGEKVIQKLVRQFTCDDQKIELTDEFDSNYESFTERFVSVTPPFIEENHVRIGNVTLLFDPTLATLNISQEVHEFHCGVAPHGQTPCPDMQTTPKEMPVYLIDFHLKKALQKITFTFLIED